MKTTFSDHLYDMCYPPGIEYHWWTLARNRLLANILRSESGGTGVFLEVGCGKGVVVKSLKDSGTDACEWAIERRSQITGLLLLDVLEHLPEPEEFLKKLESSFPKLAVIIITVPTCQEIWSNYDSFCGHYRRYTLGMLDELATHLKWKTKSAGYFFRFPYLPMRLMSLLGVDRNTKINPPGKMMRPLHRLVSAACQLEQALVPGRIRGSSAYGVYYTDRVGQTQ
jgi:hypothetical protein